MAYVVQQIVRTTDEWAEFDQNNPLPIPENFWLFEQVTDETGTYYKFKISDGVHLYGALPYQLLNGRSAKINEAGDMMIFDDVQQTYINSGVTVSAYHIAVKYENFKGSIQDFAKQFANFNKYGEQQGGKFVNAGPGWNSFNYPEEFGEEVFLTTTVEDKAAYASVRNVTKVGFQYCVYDYNGNTVTDNVVINYNAVTMSNQNLSRSMAKSAGLNPFDYDNLEQLFTRNADEIVANETAFGMTKRSSMVAAKYLCHLTGLDLYQYHNVASAAADSTAMNFIAASPAAREFVQSSPAAYDALRLSEMAMAKYSVSLAGTSPDNFSSMADIFADENALDAIVNNAVAMAAVAGSAVAMAAVRKQQNALNTVLNSHIAMTEVANVTAAVSSFFNDANALHCLVINATAMAAVAASATAMAAIRAQQAALDRILNSTVAMTEVVKITAAVSSFFNDANALHCLVINATAMAAVAGSATAMAAIMKNSQAREKFFAANYSVGRGIATYANISNNTLIGLQSLSAVAASATAMSAVAASAVASAAVASVISTYRTQIVSAISSSNLFSKSNATVGNGSGTTTHGINTNSIYIPTICYDDNDTDFTVFTGVNTTVQITYIARHSGNSSITSGVGLRGTQVVGSGSSVGNVQFDIYTVN